MQRKRIAATDIEVSVLGLGTVKLGRNQGVKYPTTFTLPTDAEAANLLAVAKELGVNFLDTAPAYGTSEERLGGLLQGKRHEWVLASKVGEEFIDGESHFDFSASTVCRSVERSLTRLKTDYLDIVLVHSNGDDVKIIEEDNVFLTLEKLKEQGKIRAYGMSTKTIEGGLLTLKYADIAMVTYNLAYTDEEPVLAYAAKEKKSIFIKKAFASGHLQTLASVNPIQKSLAFIFAHPGATSVVAGTINVEHLREMVNAIPAPYPSTHA